MTLRITAGLSYAEYDALPGLRWSRLSKILTSPAHYKTHETREEGAESPALRFGRLVHRAILEPNAPPLLVWTGGNKVKASRAWAEFKSLIVGGNYLEPEEEQAILGLDNALVDSGIADALRGLTELTLEWEIDGRQCKARVDLITNDGLLIDLKTTRDASSRVFCADAIHRQYLGQLAFYAAGLRANGVMVSGCALLAIEKTAPFAHCLYAIGDDDQSYGSDKVATALAELARCEAADEWPLPPTKAWFQMPRWGIESTGEMP
jgi:hypothetical protein